ncbi:MAG: IS200/IS605 family transposase [Candidatus Weimeria sp.]
MENKYKRTATTVSFINYHIVFCPRYRRKIFNIPGVENRFKELTREECKRRDIDIIAMECHVDHVHMFVSTAGNVSSETIKWYVETQKTRS